MQSNILNLFHELAFSRMCYRYKANPLVFGKKLTYSYEDVANNMYPDCQFIACVSTYV